MEGRSDDDLIYELGTLTSAAAKEENYRELLRRRNARVQDLENALFVAQQENKAQRFVRALLLALSAVIDRAHSGTSLLGSVGADPLLSRSCSTEAFQN